MSAPDPHPLAPLPPSSLPSTGDVKEMSASGSSALETSIFWSVGLSLDRPDAHESARSLMPIPSPRSSPVRLLPDPTLDADITDAELPARGLSWSENASSPAGAGEAERDLVGEEGVGERGG